ncbi:MAG: sugar isomerase domain-containing protein [Opitutales bacterium]
MSSLADAFYDRSLDLQRRVREGNRETLQAAGAAIGESLAQGGVLHTFGSGHSAILARELVHRAGGLVPVSSIADPTGGWPEKVPGYGERLFARYAEQFGFEAGEVVVIISNSGRNPSPIEVALGARERGGRVVAVTGLPMSSEVTSLHPSGKRLFEVADDVLDTLGESGDAVLEVPGQPVRTGPLSSVSGVLLLNLLALEAIDWMVAHGHTPPLLRSANVEGGAEYNSGLSRRYRGRLCRPL